MGIHVSRPIRGAGPVRSVSRPGDKARPQDPRLRGAAAGTKKGPKTGESSGTKGDFGADFE